MKLEQRIEGGTFRVTRQGESAMYKRIVCVLGSLM